MTEMNALSGFALAAAFGLAAGCTQVAPSAPETQAPVAPNKPKPTLDIAGVKLAVPIDLPECEKEKTTYVVLCATSPSNVPCWRHPIGAKEHMSIAPEKHMPSEGDLDIEVGIANVPAGVYPMGKISVISGKIERVELSTFGSNPEELLRLLTQKWGAPTTSNLVDYQNGFGAKYSGIQAQWVFDELQVVYLSVAGSPDEGVIILNTAAYSASVEAKKPQSANSF